MWIKQWNKPSEPNVITVNLTKQKVPLSQCFCKLQTDLEIATQVKALKINLGILLFCSLFTGGTYWMQTVLRTAQTWDF